MHYRTIIGVLLIFSFLGIGAGMFANSHSFNYVLENQTSSNGFANLQAKSGLITQALLLLLVFTCFLGILFFCPETKIENKHFWLLGGTQFFLNAFQFLNSWKSGWYYILDPAGQTAGPLYLLCFCIVTQGFGFFLAGASFTKPQ